MKIFRSAAALVALGLASSAVFAADPPPGAGQKTPADPARILAALEAAAEKGDSATIYHIGMAYKDAAQYDMAEKWLKRAAEKGYVPAQMELARLYLTHANGDKGKEMAAAEWVRRAAEAGDADARMMLSLASSGAFAAATPPPAAIPAPLEAPPAPTAVEQKAAATLPASPPEPGTGDSAAMFRAGKAYMDAGQYGEAETWLKNAAEKEHVAAQMELARLYFMTAGGDKEKEKAGAEWVKRAAGTGDSNARMALALLYEKGIGVTQDYKQSAEIFEQLSRVGHPGAQYNLGIMYRDGLGVEKNDAKAAAFLSLAVQGYREGPERDRLVSDLQELKARMTETELSHSKSLYEEARTYFQALQQAGQSGDLARPELPSAQAIQPKEKAIRKKYDLSGFVQAGARWQTNANGAPPASAGSTLPASDYNFFAMASAGLISPPNGERLRNLDTRAVLYQTRQHDGSNSDLGFAELSSGPNINLTADGKYSIRPYLTANTIQVDHETYQVAGGGGVSFVAEVAKNSALVVNVEDIYIDFDQSSEFPDNNESDGTQLVVSARGLHRITPQVTADLGVTWRNAEAEKDWNSQDSVRISNGYSIKLPVLKEEWSPRPASLYASVAYKRAWYDAPDASTVPGIRRADKEWQGTLTGEFPVIGDWSVVPTLQRTVRTANDPLYAISNSTGSLAAMYKF